MASPSPIAIDRCSTISASRITKGAITALIGPSGVGKSTIVDLLVGLYQPTAGMIRADGRDLRQFDIDLWRHDIGYIPQEVLLFHDTVRNNVTLYDHGVSDEAVLAALDAAGAAEFVREVRAGPGHGCRRARHPSVGRAAAAHLDRPGAAAPAAPPDPGRSHHRPRPRDRMGDLRPCARSCARRRGLPCWRSRTSPPGRRRRTRSTGSRGGAACPIVPPGRRLPDLADSAA